MLMSALSATADSEIFYTCSWNEAEKQVQFTTQTEDCQVIEGSHPDDWITLGGGYFVVRGQSEYKVLNIVGGEVHLVIPYGAKITTKHVKLEKGRTLHIHSTAKDDGGLEQLVVKNDAYKNAAGIGSAKGVDAGDLYIHGGYIKTTGYEYGAGIGGGENGSCGNVYIYSGRVAASGGNGGAGIGGGKKSGIASGCSVNIYGGNVRAYGHGEIDYHESGAGIGGGCQASQGGAVNIYDGDVLGEAAQQYAAGIGGGADGDGGEVNIHGGMVTARGGVSAAAIGGGRYSKGGVVTITGGTVYALSANMGVGFGSAEMRDHSNRTIITGGTVVAGAEKQWVSGGMSGTVEVPIGHRAFRGFNFLDFDNMPIGYGEILDACNHPGHDKFNCIRIEPCENHHFVDYRCTYCSSEFYETATGTWQDDGIRATEFSQQEADAKTITITSEAELGLLAYNISRDTEGHGYKDWVISLGKDLDMSAHKWYGYGTFRGTFDGQGHTIKGLCYSKSNTGDAGLIAHNNGTVKNVKLASSFIVGNRYIGAVVGNNMGTVENCYVASDVSLFTSNSDDISKACGGVVGLQMQNPFDETVAPVTRGCYSEASVNGSDNVGGIIGRFDGGTLSHCVSSGTVIYRDDNGKKDIIACPADEGITYSNNYHTTPNTSRLGSRMYSVSLSPGLSEEYEILAADAAAATYDVSRITAYAGQMMVDGKWYVGEGGTFRFKLPASTEGHDHLSWSQVTVNHGSELIPEGNIYSFTASDAEAYEIDAAPWEGEGTEESPYLIYSTADWNSLCRVLPWMTAEEPFNDVFFKQMADFDIYQSIGATEDTGKPFCGTYDGNSHRLNCSLSYTVPGVAPFHSVRNATIKNLQVTGSVSGGIHSAGLVGYSMCSGRTTIDNCRISVHVTFTGNDTNDAHGGGIIGHATECEYNVRNCLFDGTLTAQSNGKGDMHLGAIVGWGGSSTHRLIDMCIENGSYDGAGKDRVAFCWMDDGTPSPTSYGGNYYFSDLGHSDGAEKLLSVGTDTEEVVLDFYNHTWQTAYHDALFKSNRSGFLVGGRFYIVKGQPLSFKLDYPSSWNVTGVLAGSTSLTDHEGIYTISQVQDSVIISVQTDEPDVILYDDMDNEATLASNSGQRVDVILRGRTLYKNGSWNTLCLPFDMSLKGSPLEDASVKTLDASYFDNTTGTLTLYFSDDVTSIRAGKPYIIRWQDGDDVFSPVFERVTINALDGSASATECVNFLGAFSPVSLAANDRSVLYLGAGSTLYYPNSNMNVGSCRAYFSLNDLTVADLTNGIKAFELNFNNDDNTTDIDTPFALERDVEDETYYTLDGCKLSGKPSQRGIYVHNSGKVIIIK